MSANFSSETMDPDERIIFKVLKVEKKESSQNSIRSENIH